MTRKAQLSISMKLIFDSEEHKKRIYTLKNNLTWRDFIICLVNSKLYERGESPVIIRNKGGKGYQRT